MKNNLTIIATLFLIVIGNSVLGMAADDVASTTAVTAPDMAMMGDEMEYSFGEVKGVSASELVLTEYDYLTDQESDVTYSLDPALKLENVNALTDLKVGDSVEIDYILEGDKKIVKNLILEKLEEEDLAGADAAAAEMDASLALPSTPEDKAISVDDVAKQ